MNGSWAVANFDNKFHRSELSPDSGLNENGFDEDGTDFGFGTETKMAETEQFYSAESEENKKFVIRSVVDGRSRKEISLKEAIEIGVIVPSEGVYVDHDNGKRLPIPVAMKEGLIKVMFTTTKRTKREEGFHRRGHGEDDS